MVYSLLELDTWEFRRVNRYLEQVMADIQEEDIETKIKAEAATVQDVEEETVQKISKRK